MRGVSLLAAVGCAEPAPAPVPETGIQIYKTVDGRDLVARVYRPAGPALGQGLAAAILVHGGGWTMGEPGWMEARGQRLASLGVVAVAVEYRLSDQASVTPLEAMADVRDALRWMRRNATSLGIDPDRIAALGVSAGGHLAAAAAMIDPDPPDSISAAPNAFLFWYPALSLAGDGWLQRILLDRAPVSSIDPVQHVKRGLPPTLIFVGANDSLTPLRGQEEFCARMQRAGNSCSIHVYPGLGHLFMKNPWGEGNEPSDSAARVDASLRAERFLDSLGYLNPSGSEASRNR
jgi:acetyl esterase/lipase